MNRKIVLVIMDGIGTAKPGKGNQVSEANTPVLDELLQTCPNCLLKAHGAAVGLPSDDDMGNSEVGHNALGCGQIYSQGAKLVNESIENGSVFSSNAWDDIVTNCKSKESTLHFIGLLSDGNVHSNIYHLFAMMEDAKKQGVQKCCIHILLDGRDVPSQSALEYVSMLEQKCLELQSENFSAYIASGGGRMVITMDRYEADWEMVKKGWDTHVKGEGRQFANATEAITCYREEGCDSDQYLPPFVVARDGAPIGQIKNGDSVVLFNFRGDRAIELSRAFEEKDFTCFDRGDLPDVTFAGMLQYDGDLKIPHRFLVSPPHITNTLTEVLCEHKINEYAVSETQKFGHVTYFWNGNRSEKISETYETYEEIPSDKVPFEQRPWMKAAEVSDCVINAINSCKYDFIRCNFPNGDMVGHTGDLQATRIAVECVDLQLKRIKEACHRNQYIMLVVADHGNADQMIDIAKDGSEILRTAHSLNPVPFLIYAPDMDFKMKDGQFGLANVAPTILDLFGIEAPNCWQESVILKA